MNLDPRLVWLLIGVGLVLLELVTPGLVLIFFGLGAFVVAGLLLVFDLPLHLQVLVFAAASVASLVGLRRLLRGILGGKTSGFDDRRDIDDEFSGGIGAAVTNLDPGRSGRVAFKGTEWDAEAAVFVAKGDRVRIVRRENLRLFVEKAS